MTEKLRIGLLTPFPKPITGYARGAVKLGLELVVVTPRGINWPAGEVQGLVWNGEVWQEQTVPLPRALYNRFYGPKPKLINRLELVIGKNRVFNHVTRFDKGEIHRLLSRSPLNQYLPSTAPYARETLLQYINTFDQAIVKPQTGQFGSGVYWIRRQGRQFHLHQGTKSPIASFRSGAELLAYLEALDLKDCLIQKFIPLAEVGGRIFDVRLLVQKGEKGRWAVTGSISRLALRYSYITNLSHSLAPARETLKGAFPGEDFLPELEKISLQAAPLVEEHLGSLGEISVDFGLEPTGRIWIIELNGKPMKSIFGALQDKELVRKIYEQPLRYAKYLALN